MALRARLKIKPEKGLGEIEVETEKDFQKRIKGLGERYGISGGHILRTTFIEEFRIPEGNVEKLG